MYFITYLMSSVLKIDQHVDLIFVILFSPVLYRLTSYNLLDFVLLYLDSLEPANKISVIFLPYQHSSSVIFNRLQDHRGCLLQMPYTGTRDDILRNMAVRMWVLLHNFNLTKHKLC